MKLGLKAIVTAVSLSTLAVLTGCATPFPLGLIYTSAQLPVTVGSGDIQFSKKGESKCQSVLGLFASGDASINAACAEAKIKKVAWVNQEVLNILGIYGCYKTVVFGE